MEKNNSYFRWPKRVNFRRTKKFLIENHGANFLKVIDALVDYPCSCKVEINFDEEPFVKLSYGNLSHDFGLSPCLCQFVINNGEESFVKLSYGNLSHDTGLSIDTLKLQIKYLESLDFITLKNDTQRNSTLYILHFNHLFDYIRAVEFEMEDEFEKWNSSYKVREFYKDLFNDCKGNLDCFTEDIIFNKVFDSVDHVGDFIYLVDYGVKMYKEDYFEIIKNYSPTVMNLIGAHVYDDFESMNLTYPRYETMQLTYAIEKEELDLNDIIFEAIHLDISKDELIICIHDKIVAAMKRLKIDTKNNAKD